MNESCTTTRQTATYDVTLRYYRGGYRFTPETARALEVFTDDPQTGVRWLDGDAVTLDLQDGLRLLDRLEAAGLSIE